MYCCLDPLSLFTGCVFLTHRVVVSRCVSPAPTWPPELCAAAPSAWSAAHLASRRVWYGMPQPRSGSRRGAPVDVTRGVPPHLHCSGRAWLLHRVDDQWLFRSIEANQAVGEGTLQSG